MGSFGRFYGEQIDCGKICPFLWEQINCGKLALFMVRFKYYMAIPPPPPPPALFVTKKSRWRYLVNKKKYQRILRYLGILAILLGTKRATGDPQVSK